MFRDLNYLYRSFNPKMVTYETDGCGRDLYISSNNGGMIKVYQKEIRPMTNSYVLNRSQRFYNLK